MAVNIFFPFNDTLTNLIHGRREIYNSQSKLVASIFISLLISGVGYLLNYFLNMFLSRLLQPVLYGDYAAALAVLQFCAVFVLLGSDSAVMKYIPSYIKEKRWGDIRGYLAENRRRLLYRGLMVFILGIVIAGGLLVLRQNKIIMSFERYHPVVFFIWTVPFVAAMTFFTTLLRSLQKVFWALLQSKNTLCVFIFFCIIVSYWIFDKQLNVYSALSAYVFAMFLLILLQIITIAFLLPKEIKSAEIIQPHKRWMRIAFELLLSMILMSNVSGLFLILLEIFGKNEASAGAFSVILVITNILWLVYKAAISIVAPSISLLVQRKEKKHLLQRLMNTVSLIIATINGAIVSIILIFGRQLLSHFHESFVHSYFVLATVMVGIFFVNCFGVIFPILRYSGMQRFLIKVSTSIFFPIIIVSSILIHYFDISGAAISFALTAFVYTTICGILVKKKLALKPFFLF